MSTAEIPKIPDTADELVTKINDSKMKRGKALIGGLDSTSDANIFLHDLVETKELPETASESLIPGPTNEDYQIISKVK